MAQIESLRIRMQEKNDRVRTGFLFGDSDAIKTEQVELDQWITCITGLVSPPNYRVLAALRRFRAEKGFSSIMQMRHACHGCLVLYDRQASCLMEDAQAFPMLLEQVGRYHHRPRLFRRCFQGLMTAWFTYEPGIPNPAAGPYHNRDIGWKNRQRLRLFLQKHQHDIRTQAFNPDWVSVISNHPALFSENPCLAYVGAALKNDFSAFNDLCERLKIGKSSWFSRGLVYGQVDRIIEKPDREFRQHIDMSINLLNRNRWSVNKGLAKIINRYAEGDNIDANSRLRDFSVSQWKNPWLTERLQGWKPVSEAARKMVSVWIKQHLVRQFFWILAEGTPSDVRRAEFWMQYYQRFDALYFVLGSHAANNSSRDFIEIRKIMEGHLLGADRPDSNACIFIMGSYAIVEFGANGIPAHIYDRRGQLPFELKRGFRIIEAQLRNRRAAAFVQALDHHDVHERPWEEIFETALLRLGIRK